MKLLRVKATVVTQVDILVPDDFPEDVSFLQREVRATLVFNDGRYPFNVELIGHGLEHIVQRCAGRIGTPKSFGEGFVANIVGDPKVILEAVTDEAP